ncbi:hypothetical protein Osc1_15260 [Hominimerdicola sp. 21CYCFAH17_S]
MFKLRIYAVLSKKYNFFSALQHIYYTTIGNESQADNVKVILNKLISDFLKKTIDNAQKLWYSIVKEKERT